MSKWKNLKSKRWYIRYPGDFYALGPVTLPKETSDNRVCRQYCREMDNVNRLPVGFECWPTLD